MQKSLKQYIYEDDTLEVDNIDDVVSRLEMAFQNQSYIREVNRSNKNWIGIETEKVLEDNLSFFRSLK